MIIRTLELLFEYIALTLCIHKVAKQKIKLNLCILLPFLIEWINAIWSDTGKISIACKFTVLGGIFLYTKIKVVKEWKLAVTAFGIGVLVVISLQALQYYLFEILIKTSFIVQYEVIIVNFNICILASLWKEKYNSMLMAELNKVKGVAIFLLVFVRIIHILNQNPYADLGIVLQILFETIAISVACILWISAEKEKNHKVRELNMYELYNRAFEESIMTIRTRQHEFENHINAIRCMKYTISDHEELILEQERYCEKVLQENKLNKLLKLNIEPVLIGFLYSKITSAEEKGISIKYEIQSVDIKEKIAIYEFIELIGILFDNAVEALEEKECRQIILKLQMDTKKSFSLEVANISPVYSNSEIEKFCSYGYSTKGEKRGVGLSRTKAIAQKYNAIYHIQNCIYDSNNYLSFKLKFN